jgi:hypothetical protein
MNNACLIRNILIGILIFVILFSAIGSIVGILLKNDHNAIYKDRTEKCLDVYKNYSLINQNPIPNGGKYYNQFFKKTKYYGLRDFFYAASYKSYLPCGYTNDVVSYNAIKDVLLAGARVINLDIFFKGSDPFADDAKIIVGNVIDGELSFLKGTSTDKQYLEFMNCLEIINELAWKKTNSPLILYLNMEFLPNTKLEYQIYSQIFAKCSANLMDKYYGFQRINIGDIPVNMTVNKLIILTNRIPINGFLNEITNGVMSEDSVNVILYKITSKDIEYGGIKTNFAKKEDAIKISMFNLVAVIKESLPNNGNKYNPKIDSMNYDASNHFDLGISITFMNWQSYPKDYLEKFKDGGMILKPAELIYIPRPKPPVEERNTNFDYETTRVTGLNGFYDFEF